MIDLPLGHKVLQGYDLWVWVSNIKTTCKFYNQVVGMIFLFS